MAICVILTNFTTRQRKALESDPKRMNHLLDAVEKTGARVVSQYKGVGHYDLVNVLQVADEQTADKAMKAWCRRKTHRSVMSMVPFEYFG